MATRIVDALNQVYLVLSGRENKTCNPLVPNFFHHKIKYHGIKKCVTCLLLLLLLLGNLASSCPWVKYTIKPTYILLGQFVLHNRFFHLNGEKINCKTFSTRIHVILSQYFAREESMTLILL